MKEGEKKEGGALNKSHAWGWFSPSCPSALDDLWSDTCHLKGMSLCGGLQWAHPRGLHVILRHSDEGGNSRSSRRLLRAKFKPRLPESSSPDASPPECFSLPNSGHKIELSLYSRLSCPAWPEPTPTTPGTLPTGTMSSGKSICWLTLDSRGHRRGDCLRKDLGQLQTLARNGSCTRGPCTNGIRSMTAAALHFRGSTSL